MKNTLVSHLVSSRHARTLSALLVVYYIVVSSLVAQPYPEPMASWSATDKQMQREAGAAMIEYVESEIANGITDISVPKGDYRFNTLITGLGNPTHVAFQNLDGITIDFQGSTLWLENARSAMVLNRCKNTTLRNLTLDWDPLPFIQGVVTSIDTTNNTIHVDLDSGYEQPAAELLEGGKWRGAAFDPVSRELKPDVCGYYLTFNWNTVDGNGDYIVSFNGFYGVTVGDSGLEAGDLIAIFPRIARAIRISGGENVTLEDITLYSSPFIGIVAGYDSGRLTFRRCVIDRRPGTNRLMACNADGINVHNSRWGPIIEDCSLNYLGDDGVNIYMFLNRLVKAESPTSIISSKINYRAKEEINAGTPLKMYFYDHETMELIGERYVTAVENVENYTIDENDCLADLDEDPWHGGDAASLAYGATITVQRLTLDQPITITSDTITMIEGYLSEGGRVRRVSVNGSLARGFRLQSPDIVLQDCIAQNTHGSGISLGGHSRYWGAGPYVEDAQIINNTLTHSACGRNPIEQAPIIVRQGGDYKANYIQKNITIANNVIMDSQNTALIVRGVNGLTLADNIVTDYMWAPPVAVNDPLPVADAGTGYGIVVESVDGLTLRGNTAISPAAYAVGPFFHHNIENGPWDAMLALDGPVMVGGIGSGVTVTTSTHDSPFPWLSDEASMTVTDTSSNYGIGAGVRYDLYEPFAGLEPLSIAFDYQVLDSGDNNQNISLVVKDANGAGGAFLRLWVDDGSGGHGIGNQLNSGTTLLGIPVAMGEWLRVEMLIHPISQGSDQYSLLVTNEANETRVAYHLPFRLNLSNLGSISFVNNTGSAATGSFQIANVRVSKTPANDMGAAGDWIPLGNQSHPMVGVELSAESSPIPWLGSSPVLYYDQTTSAGIGAGIGYELMDHPFSDIHAATFDFKIPDPTGTDLQLNAGYADNAGNRGSFLLLHYPDGQGGYELAYQSNSGVHSLGIPLAAGVWHRIEMVVPRFTGQNDRFTVCVQPEDGATMIAANIPFRMNIGELARLDIWNNSDSSRMGSVIVDNVRINETAHADSYEMSTCALEGNVGAGISADTLLEHSPFPWLSEAGFSYTDTSSAYGMDTGLAYTFSGGDKNEAMIVVFDVKVPTSSQSDLSPAFSLNEDGTDGNCLMFDYQDGSGAHYLANYTDSGIATLTELAPDSWYRVEVTIDDLSGSGDVYQIRLTDEGGQTQTFSDVPFRVDLGKVNGLRLYSASTNSSMGSFLVDNLRLCSLLVVEE
ncbi:MAG: right-handed parallel beta-helix repeat-containing protein [Verrucomicrobiota bacterium JB024]|nr:right-handed parallel beta-helix repeat-containing protein [Verrucomicrobiota bacterium JB024]